MLCVVSTVRVQGKRSKIWGGAFPLLLSQHHHPTTGLHTLVNTLLQENQDEWKRNECSPIPSLRHACNAEDDEDAARRLDKDEGLFRERSALLICSCFCSDDGTYLPPPLPTKTTHFLAWVHGFWCTNIINQDVEMSKMQFWHNFSYTLDPLGSSRPSKSHPPCGRPGIVPNSVTAISCPVL